MRAILSVVIVLSILPFSQSMGKQVDATIRVEELKVIDLVGDPSARGSFEPLIRRILENKNFLRYHKESEFSEFGLGAGCDKIPNVFRPLTTMGTSEHPVTIQVEVEQVYYGEPTSNMKGALVVAWLVGPLLAALGSANADVVTGYVQLRVTLHSRDFPEDVTVVATGAHVGDIESLSRSVAIDMAAVNAVWNTAYLIVEKLNSQWDLGLKSKYVSVKPEEFRKVYDDWAKGVR